MLWIRFSNFFTNLHVLYELSQKSLPNLSGDLGFKAQEFQEDNFISEPDENSLDSDHLAPSNPQLALTTAALFGREGIRKVSIYT